MKKNKFFIVCCLLLSFHIQAQKHCPQHYHPTSMDQFKQLNDLVLPLLQQDCAENTTDELTLLKENYIDHYKSSPLIQKNLHGLKLNDHKLAIDALNVMLEDKPTKLIAQARECRTVICVLEKLTGQEKAAYQLLDIYRDTGYALSFKKISAKQTKHWSADQIDKIYTATHNMPKELKKLKALTHFYVLEENFKIDDYMRELGDRTGYENAGALASLNWKNNQARGDIFFNPTVFEHNHAWASETILHEIAHHFDYQAIIDSSGSSQAKNKGFYDLSGWKEIGPNKWHIDQDNACFITDYAQTNPKEHFAETISHFLTQPIALKMKCPAYYEFSKNNIFNGYDPLKVDQWNEFESALAKHAPDLFECLDPRLEKYIYFQQKTYYQSTETGASSYLTSYTPNINQQCLLELLKPIQTDLAQDNNYCEKGGLKKILEISSLRLQATLDLFVNENNKIASDHQLSQNLHQCLKDNTLTLACLRTQNTNLILKSIQSHPEVADWFGNEFLQKQIDQISQKQNLYATNDISSFSKKYEAQMLQGCLASLNNISVSNSSVIYSSNYFNSTTPFVLEECQKAAGNQLMTHFDDEILQLIFNQNHFNSTLNLISSKVIIPYSQEVLTCGQDEKCRSVALTNLIQSQPELKGMENELVKIITEKYRN
jgi:hypothetical protein